MIERCYSDKSIKTKPTYIDTTVCEEWLNFNNFLNWVLKKSNFKDTWQLDKDLIDKESEIYSPDTCIFAPQGLNKFMTNIKSSNTSGHIGVEKIKDSEKYTARIQVLGDRKQIGVYDTIEDASNAYKLERKLACVKVRNFYSFDLPKHILENLEE